MKRLLFSMCTLLLSSVLWAQQQRVSGIVSDAETGESLIGVSINIKGTTTGTITDVDGNYMLDISEGAVILFSYLGYQSQEIKWEEQTTINVNLQQESNLLEEFVVVGYTVQKKRDVLGSVSKVNNKELVALPVSSAEQALQGRIAGVNVTNTTGAPGAGVSVRVRGVGSVNSKNDPLYIVDGIPVENALGIISPNDIENITILKDASSAAIYGSRATNGVVLITTKSGQKGDAKITYNGQYGFQTHGKLVDMVSSADYITIYNEATRTDNAASSVQRPLIEGDYLKDFANVNYMEEIFRTAPIQTHEISISGGNDKTSYLFSGQYFDQEGIVLNSSHSKGSVRANITSEVKKWLTVGLNVTGGVSNTHSVPSSGDGYANSEGGSVIRYAFFRNPAVPVYDSSGAYVDKPSEYYGNAIYDTFFGDGYNPIGVAKMVKRERKENNLLASGNVLIKLPASLTLKTVMGVDYKNGSFRNYSSNWGTDNRINNPNSLALENYTTQGWTVNSVLNHNITFNEKHTLSSMIGTEAIQYTSNSINGSNQKFLDENKIYLNTGFGTKQVSEGESAYSLASFFANINYNYDMKYYLSGILRKDGSSRFYGDNKWGTFYSLSAGWNVESEDFMKDITAINQLKLRAGWGEIGNQNIPLYAYTDRYSENGYYPMGGESNVGYVQTKSGNKDLKWEVSRQLNVGLDMAFLKNAFGFTVDYYHKMIHDMLVLASYPISTGYAEPPYINNGKVLNTGIDAEVFFRQSYDNSGFEIRLNGGYLKNEVKEIDSPMRGGRIDNGVYATYTEVGQPIGSFYMLEMDGIFQNTTEVLTSAYQGSNIQPGDVKYVDHNKDGKIDSNDRVHLGSAIPKFTGGLNLSGHWKSFDASCFFQGAFGHKIYSQIQHDSEGYYRGFPVTQRYFDERWTGEGTSNTQPRASWSAKANNVRASSRFLEDGDYARLKNLQIGYTIPNLKHLGIDNLRIYLAGTNLLTFTKYSGLDPEMTVSANASGEGDRATGIDWGTYPVARSYTLGVNLTF